MQYPHCKLLHSDQLKQAVISGVKDLKKLKIKFFENDHFHCMVSKGYSTQGFSAKTKFQQIKMAEQKQYWKGPFLGV